MKRAKNIVDLELDIKDGLILSISDLHIPFHDEKYISTVFEYISQKRPDVIVLNGDVLDFFMLSRFTKGEGRNPAEEVAICRDILKQLREVTGDKTKIYYIIGNHETRLERYVLTQAPHLSSLIEDVFSILKVDEFNVRGCEKLTVNNSFVFKHGALLGNKSGLSAIKEMENSYMSGATGHCHRLAKYIARKAGKKFVWLESGCGCRLDPYYMVEPNWQQGFIEVEFRDNKLYHSKTIEVENGKILT